jgi:hypothetical protein
MGAGRDDVGHRAASAARVVRQSIGVLDRSPEMTTPRRRPVHGVATRTTPSSWTVVVTVDDGRPVGTLMSHGALGFAPLVVETLDIAAEWLGAPVDDLDLRLVVELPEEARHLWARASRPETSAEEARVLRRRTVRLAHGQGYTPDAIAEALDLPRARVARLLRADSAALAAAVADSATRALADAPQAADPAPADSASADSAPTDSAAAGSALTDSERSRI